MFEKLGLKLMVCYRNFYNKFPLEVFFKEKNYQTLSI